VTSLTAAGLSEVFGYDYQDCHASNAVNNVSTSYGYEEDDRVGEISRSGIRFALQGPNTAEPPAQL
jgi:hypothetical protein